MLRALSLAVLLSALAAAPATAGPPRTADGRPDLTGVWTNASATWLTRAPGTKLTVSAAEAAALARANPLVRRLEVDAAPSQGIDQAPAAGGDPGGYNAFWLDPGSQLARVKGQYRTSWLVDPADGRLPLSEAGQKLVAATAAAHRVEAAEGPEALMPWDRCLISSRGSGGPGMLNNIYNSNYQIVQAPGAVAIVVEMVHDARTIPIFPDKAAAQAAHGPAALGRWLGDSVGWWEGDTLVVETLHVNAEQGRSGPIYLSPQGRVTERLTRLSAGEILYGFEVEDPVYYSRPWRAEMTLSARKDRLYEYACHEGNYALPGILAGARQGERGGR